MDSYLNIPEISGGAVAHSASPTPRYVTVVDNENIELQFIDQVKQIKNNN